MNGAEEIPKRVREIANDFLLEKQNDREGVEGIEIEKKGEYTYYAYQKIVEGVEKVYWHMMIDNTNGSFLIFDSKRSYDFLQKNYEAGIRTILQPNRKLRRFVKLPIIKDDAERRLFAKNLAIEMVELFDKDVRYEKWYAEEEIMIENALMLLLSSNEREKLSSVTGCFRSPKFVKYYLGSVTDKKTYDYWTSYIPRFMKRNESGNILNHFFEEFNLTVGEDRIQNICRIARQKEQKSVPKKAEASKVAAEDVDKLIEKVDKRIEEIERAEETDGGAELEYDFFG